MFVGHKCSEICTGKSLILSGLESFLFDNILKNIYIFDINILKNIKTKIYVFISEIYF